MKSMTTVVWDSPTGLPSKTLLISPIKSLGSLHCKSSGNLSLAFLCLFTLLSVSLNNKTMDATLL